MTKIIIIRGATPSPLFAFTNLGVHVYTVDQKFVAQTGSPICSFWTLMAGSSGKIKEMEKAAILMDGCGDDFCGTSWAGIFGGNI